jgi:hypothetical protein
VGEQRHRIARSYLLQQESHNIDNKYHAQFADRRTWERMIDGDSPRRVNVSQEQVAVNQIR